MSTHNFTYLTRLIQAIFILLLCGLLAAGAFAREARPDRRGDRDSVKQETKAEDEKDQKSNPRGRQARQSDDSKSQEQARSTRGEPRTKPSSDDHKATPAPTGTDSRQDQKPDANTSHPGDSRNRHDNGSKNPPVIDSKPPVNSRDNNNWSNNNWGNRDRNKQQAYTPDRNRDRDDNWSRSHQPTSYRPQSYQSSSYHARTHYYPSHPKPYSYGHWVFERHNSDECRRSVYFHYGYFPYLQITRAHTLNYIVIGYRSTRIATGRDYYLSRDTSDLDRALADIRDAWTGGRYDLIDRHIDSSERIAVLLDGRYDYSIDADDYTDMTSDALDEVSTLSFTWESIRERTDGDYTAFGKHLFRDSRGDLQTVYVSYTLRRIGQDYMIEEVGSSNSPLI